MTMQTVLKELEQFNITNAKTTETAVPLTRRETEEPPPLPNFTYSNSLAPNIQVTLERAETSEETCALASAEPELWPQGSCNQHVLLVNVPDSSVESIAFGLYDLVGSTNLLLKVAFVARMSNDERSSFVSEMTGITVEELLTSDLPQSLQDYLRDELASAANLVPASVLRGPPSNDEGFTQVAA